MLTTMKRILRTLFSLLLAGGVGVAVWATGATRFPTLQGERTYYLHSASSQAKMTSALSPLEFSALQGESVRLSKENSVEELLEACDGEILFIEEVCGVRSYYCFTPKWSDGVRLGEHFVNLHIAVSKEACVVGAPIIFGGF